MLEPFDEAVLVAVADGAGALAWVVEGRAWLRAATADTTGIFVLHGGLLNADTMLIESCVYVSLASVKICLLLSAEQWSVPAKSAEGDCGRRCNACPRIRKRK